MTKTFKTLVSAAVAIAASFQGLTTTSHAVENVFTTMDIQDPAPWALDRLDGSKDGKYFFPSSGQNVRIYIVDTGVDATHPDFGGRVLNGFDAFGTNLDQTDCHGHGTHVAGLAAGQYFGAAKQATIVPVRVMNCSGQGSTSTLTAGIDWILANNPSGTTSIVNMSIGGPKDTAVNAATARLISAGIVVVAAAGNSNTDACNSSPASTEGVIAVGSIDNADIKSAFSNWGDCVDIFAPGSRISSDSPFNHATSVQKSGTSQASPFVSGILATYISSRIATLPSRLEQSLHELSERGVVIGGRSKYNDIANVAKVTETSPVVVSPSAPALISSTVQDLFILNIDSQSVSLAWNPRDDVKYYSVKIGKRGQGGYIYTSNTSTTETIVPNLYSNTDYLVRVIPYGKSGQRLAEGSSLEFHTPYGVPSIPRNFKIKNDTLTWTVPSYSGGSFTPTYTVQKLLAGAWSSVAQTTNTYYHVVSPAINVKDTYRVLASTPAGLGIPTEPLELVGSGVPDSFEPVPDLSSSLAGTVVVTQRRAGSGAVNVTWALTAGSAGYDIYIAPLGTDAWTLSASVSSSATSRVIAIKLNQDYVIRVTSKTNTGVATDIGMVQYRGN